MLEGGDGPMCPSSTLWAGNRFAPTNSANGLTWLVVWTAANADAERAAKVLAHNEARPLRDRLLAINGWVGDEVVCFAPYALN